MAGTFKIPKRKQCPGSDSAHLRLASPLLRLQDSAPEPQVTVGQVMCET